MSGLIDKLPSHHFNWTEVARPQIIWLWVIAVFIKQFITLNNMQNSYRYLSVKDGHQARKAALLATYPDADRPADLVYPSHGGDVF